MQTAACVLAVFAALATSAALAVSPTSVPDDEPSYMRVQRMDQEHLRLAMSPLCSTPFAVRNYQDTITGKAPFNEAMMNDCWLLDKHPKIEVVRMIDPMTAEVRFYIRGKWAVAYVGPYQIEEGDPDPATVSQQSQNAQVNTEAAEKYGLADTVISAEEQAADQKYSGFPNSQLFNNRTKCSKVVALFKKPGVKPADQDMAAFLRYARVKLMEIDTASHVIRGTPLVVDQIGSEKWKLLPALYPSYCRGHLRDTLEDATGGVFAAAAMLR